MTIHQRLFGIITHALPFLEEVHRDFVYYLFTSSEELKNLPLNEETHTEKVTLSAGSTDFMRYVVVRQGEGRKSEYDHLESVAWMSGPVTISHLIKFYPESNKICYDKQTQLLVNPNKDVMRRVWASKKIVSTVYASGHVKVTQIITGTKKRNKHIRFTDTDNKKHHNIQPLYRTGWLTLKRFISPDLLPPKLHSFLFTIAYPQNAFFQNLNLLELCPLPISNATRRNINNLKEMKESIIGAPLDCEYEQIPLFIFKAFAEIETEQIFNYDKNAFFSFLLKISIDFSIVSSTSAFEFLSHYRELYLISIAKVFNVYGVYLPYRLLSDNNANKRKELVAIYGNEFVSKNLSAYDTKFIALCAKISKTFLHPNQITLFQKFILETYHPKMDFEFAFELLENDYGLVYNNYYADNDVQFIKWVRQVPLFHYYCKRLNGIKDFATIKDYIEMVFNSGEKFNLRINSYRRLKEEHDKLSRQITLSSIPVLEVSSHYPTALDLPSVKAIRINTREELLEEGILMNHCVASYGQRINWGICSIYSITYKQKRYTLELRFHSKGLYIRQLKGIYNTEPPFLLSTEIGQELERLNAELIQTKSPSLLSANFQAKDNVPY